MDNKLKDNDIIKALEYCATREISNGIAHKVLDLINRQKAEIERLTKLVEEQYESALIAMKVCESEAINAYHEEVTKRCIEGGIYPAFVNRQMEDVRKEMAGEQQ